MALSVIASTIYVQKIVEYILIPNVAESHFVIIGSMLMIFVANSLTTQYFLLYGEGYTAIVNTSKQESNNGIRRIDNASYSKNGIFYSSRLVER